MNDPSGEKKKKNLIFLDSQYNTISQNRESPIHQFIADLPANISDLYTYNSELGYKAFYQPDQDKDTIYSVTLLKTNKEALTSLPVWADKFKDKIKWSPYISSGRINLTSTTDSSRIIASEYLYQKILYRENDPDHYEDYETYSLFLVTLDKKDYYQVTITKYNFNDQKSRSLFPNDSNQNKIRSLLYTVDLNWDPTALFGYVPKDYNNPIIILTNPDI